MTDIKRYDIVVQFGSDTMEERPNGKWVKSSDIPKIKADAVREARQDIVDNVVIPKASKVRQEYYKAAIRHAISNLEAYADKLERGEV